MSFRTNTLKVQAFAGAVYGLQVGSTTMSQVNADITSNGGLINTLNGYYASSFGGVSNATVATTVATNLGLTGAALTAGAAYVEGQLNAAAAGARGAVISNILDLFAGLASDATFGTAATAYNNKVTAAAAYTGATNVAIGSTAGQGTPFTLAVGVDTLTGTAGNDTFSGPLDSWTALDKIDGGAGTDSLTIATTGTASPVGATVVGIESLALTTSGAGYTINTTTYTDLTNATVTAAAAGAVSVTSASTTTISAQATGASTLDVIGSGGALIAQTGAGAVAIGATAVANALTSATVTGGTTVAITDRSGASAATGSTLKTVTISGAAGDQTLTGNGITTVNLTKLAGATTVGDTTVTAAAGTRELTVNYNGVDIATTAGSEANGTDVLTLTDAEATTLKINAVTAASFDAGVSAAKATSVAINADVAIQLQHVTAGVATAVAISGAAKTTITTDTFASTAVITSTSTGGVTLTQALTANQQYVGTASSGVDTISIATGYTKVITTGAGNDVITYGGPAGTGGSIDAGDGSDTIVMTSAQAVTASTDAVFNSKVKGLEVLSLATAGGAATIDLLGINAVNSVKTAGAATALQTINSFTNNGTFEQTASANGGSYVLGVTGAVFNADDAFNIKFTSTATVAAGSITVSGIETLNIIQPDASTAATGSTAVTNTVTLVDAAAKSVIVSGNNGLTITNDAGNTAITKFDASGVVANGTADTTTLLAVTFASNNSTATAAVSITGGAGADTLTGNAAIDTINGGAGTAVDTITGGAGQDVLIGGGGADVFRYNLRADAVGAGGVNVDKITDFVAGTDKINLTQGGGAGVLLLGVTIATASTPAVATMAAPVADATIVASLPEVYAALAAYTALTASAANSSATVAQVYTFANGAAAGTYVVVNDSTAGFQAANDIVINLTGLSGTLSAADFTFTS
jgi:S-layer protein